MLNDVFRFSDKHANDLMTHRTDVVALYLNNTEKEVLSTIAEKHFSKYLLLDKSIDNVVGVISVKDIILMIGNQAPFDLKSIAQPALFITESL